MNELGNTPRKEYRQTYPKHFKCSGCGEQRLLMLLQDEYNLTQPLCKKCLGEAPAALVDLIRRTNGYITDLEKNRDNFQMMANKMSESLMVFAGLHKDNEVDEIIEEMKRLLEYQNKITETLTRP